MYSVQAAFVFAFRIYDKRLLFQRMAILISIASFLSSNVCSTMFNVNIGEVEK